MKQRRKYTIVMFFLVCLLIGSLMFPDIQGNSKKTKDETILYQKNNSDAVSQNPIDWWNCYHHDIANTGFSSSYGPENKTIMWTSNYDNFIVCSSPVVVNNLIYFGTYHATSPYWEGSYVCCLDTNGKEIWKYETTGNIKSTPTVCSDRLYVGGSNGQVLCLYANNGDILWSQQTGDRVLSSPVFYNDRVFIGSYDNNLYCLDAENGDIFWSYECGGDIYSSPAIYDDKVYVGSLDHYVYCLNANTGELVWNFETEDEVYSSPAVYNDRLFIGSSDCNIYCLDCANGNQIWRFDTDQKIYESSPAIAHGKLVIGTSFGDIFCLDIDNGNKLWEVTIGGWISSSPAIADDKIYIGSSNHVLYCLNAENGAMQWLYQTLHEIDASPAIVNGNLYVSSGSDIICFGSNESPHPNVKCQGSLQWSQVEPNGFVRGNFTIYNDGESGSLLDWTIDSYPSWGEWTITPESGNDVSAGESVTVNVFVVAPENKTCSFSGEITVLNNDDVSDYDTVPVVLSTPKKQYNVHPLYDFFYEHTTLKILFQKILSFL